MRKFILGIFMILLSVPMFAPNLSDAKHDMMRDSYEKIQFDIYKQDQMSKFLLALGSSESGCNYKAYNKYGYIGKYQFGYAARKDTGFGHVKFSEFVRNPDVWSDKEQDIAMKILIEKNCLHLSDVISKHAGKRIGGGTITKSGIIAAAHLAGAGGVKSYFRSHGRYNPSDAYGTSLESYLIRFSGYDV